MVMELAKGIAHVSFAGGGIFVQARNPYDRQMLLEHVADRVRANGHVQVLIDNQRWLVRLSRGLSVVCCSRCGYRLHSACYSNVAGATAYCMDCAFGVRAESVSPYDEPQRRLG